MPKTKSSKSKALKTARRDTLLRHLGQYVLETLEQSEEWSSETLDEIATKAVNLDLATCNYDEKECDVLFKINKDMRVPFKIQCVRPPGRGRYIKYPREVLVIDSFDNKAKADAFIVSHRRDSWVYAEDPSMVDGIYVRGDVGWRLVEGI